MWRNLQYFLALFVQDLIDDRREGIQIVLHDRRNGVVDGAGRVPVVESREQQQRNSADQKVSEKGIRAQHWVAEIKPLFAQIPPAAARGFRLSDRARRRCYC